MAQIKLIFLILVLTASYSAAQPLSSSAPKCLAPHTSTPVNPAFLTPVTPQTITSSDPQISRPSGLYSRKLPVSKIMSFGSLGSRPLSPSMLKLWQPRFGGIVAEGRRTKGLKAESLKDGELGDVQPVVSKALQRITSSTLNTIKVSWTNMERRADSDMSRSASGGTTWADGGWVDPELQTDLMDLLNRTTARPDTWEWLKGCQEPFQIEVLNCDEADINILFIPPGFSTLPWRRPTGTKVLSKALFGTVEVVQMLGNPNGRVPMRPATRSKIDSNDVLLYLGGPPRVYGEATMTQPCCVLEVALNSKMNMLGGISLKGFIEDAVGYEDVRKVLRMQMTQSKLRSLVCSVEEKQDFDASATRHLDGLEWANEDILRQLDVRTLRTGVGGLDEELQSIIRRVFLSRRLPEGTVESLGLQHISGVLLYGPPGCGKTLIARLISQAMTEREAVIVNGPEVLDKWVGEAERNVRALFAEAELEWLQRGRESALHVVVLDELDAFCRSRGSLRGDTSGVRDSVVNQLLAKMDGVKRLENVLVIGLTNRKDLIDPALLRPGRLEVHVEIKAPTTNGRKEIMAIHLKKMKEAGRLTPGALQWAETEPLDPEMDGWSGADIAGLVRSATSFAVQRALDGNLVVTVTKEDLKQAKKEILEAKSKKRSRFRAWSTRILKLS